MNIQKLEYLIVISEEQNFSRAAQKLFVSQPALSKSLTALESELGFPLIERHHDGLRPTPEGLIYINAAKKMVAIKNEMEEQISQLAQNKVYPPVRIGVNNATAIAEMMLFMVNQHQLEMPVFFDVDSVECTKMLQQGQLDIASLILPDGIPNDLECIMTEPDCFVVVVPNTPEYDFINLTYIETIPISALNGVKAIQCRPDSGLGIMAARYLEENNVQFNYTCSISVLSAIMKAVESGAGITLMHQSMTTWNSSYKIYALDPPMHYNHFLCIKKGMSMTPKIKRILKLLWGLEIPK